MRWAKETVIYFEDNETAILITVHLTANLPPERLVSFKGVSSIDPRFARSRVRWI